MIGVQPGIFIGGAKDVADPGHMKEAGITHILTVDKEELQSLGTFCTKFVYALDDSSTDLLSSLDDCISLIKESLAVDRAIVLVHCHSGVSRSAAVVTAYMMKTDGLSFQDAYGKIQTLKPDVEMNEEFECQLKLYEAMGCEVNFTSAIYKHYRLQKVTQKYPVKYAMDEDDNLERRTFLSKLEIYFRMTIHGFLNQRNLINTLAYELKHIQVSASTSDRPSTEVEDHNPGTAAEKEHNVSASTSDRPSTEAEDPKPGTAAEKEHNG